MTLYDLDPEDYKPRRLKLGGYANPNNQSDRRETEYWNCLIEKYRIIDKLRIAVFNEIGVKISHQFFLFEIGA